MYSFVSGFMYLVESFCVSPIVCVHPARSWYSPQFTKKRKKTKGGGKPVTIKKGTSAVAKPDSVRENGMLPFLSEMRLRRLRQFCHLECWTPGRLE